MNDFQGPRRVGAHGTDVPSYEAVQNAVAAKIRRVWSGWSLVDRQDLQQLVMIKYFDKFGRAQLPEDDDGKVAIPHAWLNVVVRNAGVDMDRKRRARPADPADFLGDDAHFLELLLLEENPKPRLSSAVAVNVDIRRALAPALESFGKSNPLDLKLIVWRYVEGREVDDIARVLNKSPAAAKIAIRRALERLRLLVVT